MTPKNQSQPQTLRHDPSGMLIHWDRRNGIVSYPYPCNTTHGWQRCPSCSAVVRSLEIACDYRPWLVRCQCGKIVKCPGITDDGRFAGLHQIIGEAEGRSLIAGEVPVNASESVRDEFAMLAAYDDYYEE
jgi:hypothetical protein